MKKLILAAISTTCVAGLMACSNPESEEKTMETAVATNQQEENADVREAVLDQLSEANKERITNWEDASVSKVIVNEENYMNPIVDKSYIGKEVYLIDYPVGSKSSTENYIAYADIESMKFIGAGLID